VNQLGQALAFPRTTGAQVVECSVEQRLGVGLDAV
jgi:hypothetical protein